MPCGPAAFIAGRPAPRGCRCAGTSPSTKRRRRPRRPGFAPCKRCRPGDASPAERHVAAIGRACALIRERDTLPSLAELAEAAGISRFHFHRVFKQITGATPREWGKAHRIGRFAELLDGGESVAASVYAAGFGASSRAYEAAPNGLGMTPATRRRGGKGETIRYTIVPTPLGHAIVAATERGICMTALGDDPSILEAELRRRFPAAALSPADAALSEWTEEIVAFITRPGAHPDLPLDISGTAFQAHGVARLAEDPAGAHDQLQRDRRRARKADRGARRRARDREQQPRRAGAVPPRRAQRRRIVRLSLGRRAQARPARSRARGAGGRATAE